MPEVIFTITFLLSLLTTVAIVGGIGYLIYERIRGPDRRLRDEELDELREQVGLMRDLVGDLLVRIRALEGGEEPGGRLPPDPALPGKTPGEDEEG